MAAYNQRDSNEANQNKGHSLADDHTQFILIGNSALNDTYSAVKEKLIQASLTERYRVNPSKQNVCRNQSNQWAFVFVALAIFVMAMTALTVFVAVKSIQNPLKPQITNDGSHIIWTTESDDKNEIDLTDMQTIQSSSIENNETEIPLRAPGQITIAPKPLHRTITIFFSDKISADLKCGPKVVRRHNVEGQITFNDMPKGNCTLISRPSGERLTLKSENDQFKCVVHSDSETISCQSV